MAAVRYRSTFSILLIKFFYLNSTGDMPQTIEKNGLDFPPCLEMYTSVQQTPRSLKKWFHANFFVPGCLPRSCADLHTDVGPAMTKMPRRWLVRVT